MKTDIKKWMRLGAVFVLIFLTGVGLAPFIFWYPPEGLVGISLLAIGILGMTIAIKKIRNSKYSNPEAYNAMIIEDRNKREKTVKLEDLPVWLIVLLGAACVVGIMGELGAFNSYPLVSFPLSILLIAFLIYYFLYKRKIAKEKYGAS